MTRHPGRTGHSRHGLFWNDLAGQTDAEIRTSPRTVACPACLARPHQPCRTRTRRHTVMNGYHDSRVREANPDA
ncbi:hypothetical protein [Amycolatopsis suaedae]|uniref:DNA-binding phage zinc finger domain-containing protein n=1 Tax=Amycolatopsis suaedae TaxID=2510978 RepID=A0A4Q7J0D1_9PSEU|nr:hypothetical protein [Amycolatopsis suaedae]RZQ59823.1 hypothetical protein EWH70_32425 [Amycolatopsis suaedae]